jgi:hypothetical protein
MLNDLVRCRLPSATGRLRDIDPQESPRTDGVFACQPEASATPDQILRPLAELRPDQGINSVHQTSISRPIEPDYRAGHSADYLHFDDDIVTLDRTLVDAWLAMPTTSDSRPETNALHRGAARRVPRAIL